MSLIAQSISNLLNGVSQRPVEQRHPSQADAQTNGLSSLARGLMKRPPLTYLGKLTSTITGWSTAFIHTINRDQNERYHVAIANGTVFVYDAITALPVTVITPKGQAYLTDTSKGYRAATAGDTTMIVNRAVTVKQGVTKAPAAKYEALLYVRQADYGTTYQVFLNDVPVGIKTVAASAPNTRESISTDKIATDLLTALTSETLLSGFTFTQYGSTIYIVRADGTDFSISTYDGLADRGLKSVKTSIQDFADLPRKAPTGFTVKVSGDPESTLDDYWVTYDDKGNAKQDGVWRECAAPGTPVIFDELTMPHRLVRKGTVVQNVPYLGGGALNGQAATVVDILTGAGVGFSTQAWAFTTPDNTAITAGTQPTLRDHGTGVKLTLVAAAKRFSVNFGIDTSLVEPGNDITVTLYKNTVSIAANTFPAAFSLPPFLPGGPKITTFHAGFDVIGAYANTDVIEVKISYAKNVTPDASRRVFVTPQPASILTSSVRQITFNTLQSRPADYLYPAGAVVTAVIDGKTFNYTVGTAPVSGDVVGAALSPTIDADADLVVVSNSPTSIIQVKNITTGTYPAITVTASLDPTKTFANPTLSEVVNVHVGRTIKNVTDGSTGVVTSNSATTITASAGLSGGVDNRFKPGDLVSVVGTGIYFVFEPCPWNKRSAGDLTIVPFPSFKDNTISDVFVYQNRLGFTSNENLVLSSSGDLFNFFRYSAAQLFADDMIDVRSAHAEVSLFHSALLWNEGLYLFSSNALWQVTGEPVLTPTTIRIDKVNSIPTTPGPRPAPAGTKLYATRGKDGYTQVQQFYLSGNAINTVEIVEAIDVTQDVPKYVGGSPLVTVADDTLGFLAVLSDADQKTIYVYSYAFDEGDRTRTQASWSKWTIPSGTIVGLDLLDGKLGVLHVQSDGVYLSTINLNVALDVVSNDEKAKYLDRRVSNTTTGVSSAYNAGPNTTTWTLPFNVATDGSEGVLQVVKRGATITLLTSTRPAANQIAVTGQGDLTAASVYIGIQYEFRYRPSRIFIRGRDAVPETRGRLTLRYIDVLYHDTTDFDVVVTLDGRAARTYTTSLLLPASGTVRIPVQGKNDYSIIELVNSTPGACAFSALDWEANYTTRSKRV